MKAHRGDVYVGRDGGGCRAAFGGILQVDGYAGYNRLISPGRIVPYFQRTYGSLRERSYSRFLTQEAERLLNHFGAETRIFDPQRLPFSDGAEASHPKVQELPELSLWAEGQVWTSADGTA